MKSPKRLISLFVFILVIGAIPLTVNLVKNSISYLSRAFGEPANLVVNPHIIIGQIEKPWQALAQGGEEKNGTFDQILPEIKNLKPRYIRIDHLYDYYDIVSKNDQQLIFNWSKLDTIVDQIMSVGALPFLSLSYMPPSIAQNHNILEPPIVWKDWQTVVQKTIEHYSGKQEKNIDKVIYEVWNEPDLFGTWKIGQNKNYLDLYKYASFGAQNAKNTNSFKIGGPSVTAPYSTWLNNFLDFTKKENLRIDFYSWHRYDTEPSKFLSDINLIDNWLFQNAGFTLDKYLTEWGSNSENSSYHDQDFDAAHLVSIMITLNRRIDLAFIFEIKDGYSPNGVKYWGRWGLLTNEKAGSVEKKPKYYALELLNMLEGKQIELTGEGTFVKAIAVKNDQQIQILFVNLDRNNKYAERTPLQINNLENGIYSLKEFTRGKLPKEESLIVQNQVLKTTVNLSPNQIILWQLEKI